METGVPLKMIFHRKHPPALQFLCTMYYKKLYVCLNIRPTEEPTTEVEKSPVAEKEGGEDNTTDAKKDAPADEGKEKEPEDKV